MLEKFRDEFFYQICIVGLRIERTKSISQDGLKGFNGFIQGNIKNEIRIQSFGDLKTSRWT